MELILLLVLVDRTLALTGYDCEAVGVSKVYGFPDQDTCSYTATQWVETSESDVNVYQVPKSSELMLAIVSRKQLEKEFYCTYYQHAVETLDPINMETYQLDMVGLQDAKSFFAESYGSAKINTLDPAVGQWHYFVDTLGVSSEGFCSQWSTHVTYKASAMKLDIVKAMVHYDEEGKSSSIHVWGSQLLISVGMSHKWLPDGSVVMWDLNAFPKCMVSHLFTHSPRRFIDQSKREFLLFEEKGVGLELLTPKRICGSLMNVTSVPYLYTTLEDTDDFEFHGKTDIGRLSTLITSSTGFLSISLSQLSNQVYQVLVKNLCDLEHSQQMSTIMDPSLSAVTKGFLLTKETGWTATVAGESIIVSRCKEIPVRIYPLNHCTNMIPVMISNHTQVLYMDPVLRSLSPEAKVIPCKSQRNPVVRIRGVWYKLSPHLSPTIPRDSLPGTLHIKSLFIHPNLVGIYPHEILIKLDDDNYNSIPPRWMSTPSKSKNSPPISYSFNGHQMLNGHDPIHVLMGGSLILVISGFLMGLLSSILSWIMWRRVNNLSVRVSTPTPNHTHICVTNKNTPLFGESPRLGDLRPQHSSESDV